METFKIFGQNICNAQDWLKTGELIELLCNFWKVPFFLDNIFWDVLHTQGKGENSYDYTHAKLDGFCFSFFTNVHLVLKFKKLKNYNTHFSIPWKMSNSASKRFCNCHKEGLVRIIPITNPHKLYEFQVISPYCGLSRLIVIEKGTWLEKHA